MLYNIQEASKFLLSFRADINSSLLLFLAFEKEYKPCRQSCHSIKMVQTTINFIMMQPQSASEVLAPSVMINT